MKVCILPTAAPANEPNFGIGRVIQAQYQYLPRLGLELVTDPEQADVVASHVNKRGLPRLDVLHCHGMYWTDQPHQVYQNWHIEANSEIIEAARSALVVTVPSQWVARPFQRDMRISPTVVGHGVDYAQWKVRQHRGYLLWNKNRNTDVCDPGPALWLAQHGVDVASTLLPVGATSIPFTFTKLGVLPFDQMKMKVEQAFLYLATAPETFGIGTLEAMAAGVPILGYKWAGTAELVQHKLTGWLAEPGDLQGLLEGYHWLTAHRNQTSANARAAAADYDWSKVIGSYVDVYAHAHALRQNELANSGAAIVITNYNYAQYLPESIGSALNQTLPPKELIVVDDGSKDDSLKVAEALLHQYHGPVDFKIISQPNSGVAAARDAGLAAATAPFVTCLDADDRLHPAFLAYLLPALQSDRGLGIAYSGLTMLNERGQVINHSTWPPEFSWETQAAPHTPPSNCIPSACLFRRSMWQRAGGWQQEYAPGEDAEFWTRGLSVGFKAKRVTNEGLFEYRGHEGSASRRLKYVPIDTWLPWMEDHLYPMGAPTKKVWVRSYFQPLVSIIMPVGPGHEHLVNRAVRSIVGQTERQWELILVDDTGADALAQQVDRLWPFATLLRTYGRQGPAPARNLGLAAAKGQFVLFLDADDWLHPQAIDNFLTFYQANPGAGYLYSDWVEAQTDPNAPLTTHHCPEFDPSNPSLQHAVTIFLPRTSAQACRFDEDLPGWEEWSYAIQLRLQGCCGRRVPMPLLYYNVGSGTVRSRSIQKQDAIRTTLRNRYPSYFTKETKMTPCGSCPGGGQTIIRAKEKAGMLSQNPTTVPQDPQVDIRLEYIGLSSGTRTFSTNGRSYRGGANTFARFVTVPRQFRQDAEFLVSTGLFRVIPSAVPPQPPLQEPPTPVKEPASTKLKKQAVSMPANAAVPTPVTPEIVAAAAAAPTYPPPDDTDELRPRPPTLRDLRKEVKKAKMAELLQWAYDERTAETPRQTYLQEIEAEIERR